jgi:hypothetical protein
MPAILVAILVLLLQQGIAASLVWAYVDQGHCMVCSTVALYMGAGSSTATVGANSNRCQMHVWSVADLVCTPAALVNAAGAGNNRGHATAAAAAAAAAAASAAAAAAAAAVAAAAAAAAASAAAAAAAAAGDYPTFNFDAYHPLLASAPEGYPFPEPLLLNSAKTGTLLPSPLQIILICSLHAIPQTQTRLFLLSRSHLRTPFPPP